MIPETVNAHETFYLLGAIVLIVGVLAAAAALAMRRRLEEEHRDERYVRERRGEDVAPVETPRLVGVLQYAGFGIAALGIVLLVVGWTLAPGST